MTTKTAIEDPVPAQVADADAAAGAANDEEHDMSLRDALHYFRPAAMWAILMSISNVMEGFNIPIGAGMILFPAFERKYGTYVEGHGYIVTFKWQISLGLAATLGGIFGVIVGGAMIERIGTRMTIMVNQFLITGAIFIQFYAPNMPVLFAATVINGIPWGMLASVGSIYASEVCPTAIRGYLINVSNISQGFGSLLCAIVLQVMVSDPTDRSFKLPFALQWIWPVPLFLVAFLAPESPWWLVRRGELDRAKAAIRRLSRNRTDAQIDAQIALMARTNRYEKESNIESGYKDCFKGTNLRRTEIACLSLGAQGLSGSALALNPTYFMFQVGLDNLNAFRVGVGSNAISLAGNFVCWFFMAKFGRRTLLNFGLVGLTVLLLFIGLLGSYPSPSAIWAQAGLCFAWTAIFAVFVAPESYTIAGEISATRVRAETLSLAKSFYGITGCASAVVQTYLTNPSGADWKGKSAYVWFGFSVLFVIWAFLRLPETKDKTYEDIDILFEKKVSARHFDPERIHASPEYNDGGVGPVYKLHDEEVGPAKK